MKKIFLFFIVCSVLQNIKSQTILPEMTLKGHMDDITALDLSKDGILLLSSSKDKTIKLWKISSGENVSTFNEHTDWVNSIKFSTDNKFFVSASYDKTIRLWDVVNGKMIRLLSGHNGWVKTVDISSDNKLIASGSADKTVKLWDVETGKEIQTFSDISTSQIDYVQFSNNNKFLAFCTWDGIISIIDLGTNKIYRTLKSNCSNLKFSTDNKSIIFIDNSIIKVWNFDENKIIHVFNGHTEIINSIFVSQSILISGSSDKTIKIWSLNNFELLKSIETNNRVSYVGFDYNTKLLSSCNGDKIFLYNIEEAFAIGKIRNIVENKINDWQKKGKYEKTIEYSKRVTELNRKKQIEIFTQETINVLAKEKYSFTSLKSEYDADNESFKLSYVNGNCFFIKVPISEADSFDANVKQFKFEDEVFTTNNEDFTLVHVKITNPENKKVYIYDAKNLVTFSSAQLKLKFDPIDISIQKQDNNFTKNQEITKILTVGKSDVDIDIPITDTKQTNVYCLIIGNEDYKSYQKDINSEINVDFAESDAKIFKEYCVKTFGIPEKNIKLLTNSTGNQILQNLDWLSKLVQANNGNAELLFYYAGHGLPDEQTKEPYLIPVDVSGNNLNYAIKLIDVYKKLTENNPKKVTVFLDACFSGGARNGSLLSLRGVKIKPKENVTGNNLIVFSSSSGDESSTPYNEKQHGLFTYFLLKKIQESKGNMTYKELSDYLQQEIKVNSLLINQKQQTPQTIGSTDVQEKWVNWKLK